MMNNDKLVEDLTLEMTPEKDPLEEFEEKTPGFLELSPAQRLKRVLIALLKVVGLLASLYFFVCSLDIMSLSFRLVGGRYATEFFQNSIVKNPVAGLMIGIVVTVVVQSSSTSTSIIVTMVAAQLLQVRQAIPIIMGANIGTSVTSTIVSLGHLGNKEDFRRAFAGAIIHDIFNFLSVIILLPLELVSHYSEFISEKIVSTIKIDASVKEPELLNAITKPLTTRIIQLDKTVLDLIAKNQSLGNETLIKHKCGNRTCDFLFEPVNWPEWSIGLLLLGISLIVLSVCLVLLVKILSSVFKGHLKKILQKTINADFPGIFKYLTPYVAISLGCVLTILVQSSSVFTSALVPLVSMGIFSLERVFPLILGSNIGTTVTGILAAFSSSPSTIQFSLQIALCHTLFNVTGILIWYPIPFMRNIPIRIAKYLSHVTESYRWFAVLYLICVFALMPLTVFALSIAGTVVLFTILALVAATVTFVIIVNVLQKEKPSWLPKILRDWKFLPKAMRSLEPYDYFMVNYILCCKKCHVTKVKPIEKEIKKEVLQDDDEKPEQIITHF